MIFQLSWKLAGASRFRNSFETWRNCGVHRPDDIEQARRNEIISCFIRKVNKDITSADQGQYKPTHVSIGPYHNGIADLPGNAEKDKSLHKMVRKRIPGGDTLDWLDRDIIADWKNRLMSTHVSRARRYYHDNRKSHESSFDMNDEDFVSMLLYDGCYILHHFVPQDGGQRQSVSLKIIRDVVFLAENQIPFFVLEEINEMVGWSTSTDSHLLRGFASRIHDDILAFHGYTTKQTPQTTINRFMTKKPEGPEREPRIIVIDHIQHLLHVLLTGNNNAATTHNDSAGKQESRFRRWRRATQYREAHVDLKGVDLTMASAGAGAQQDAPRSILDVKLRSRATMHPMRLEFPSLYVDNETWCILRNLVAMEDSNASHTCTLGHRVTAYCMLMYQLACKADDVELLAQRGVVEHLMSTDEVCAKYFAELCSGIIFDIGNKELNYLWKECGKVDACFKSRRSKWTAWMLREYFRNPCLTLAFVAAILVTLCTALQAAYTMWRFTKGPK